MENPAEFCLNGLVVAGSFLQENPDLHGKPMLFLSRFSRDQSIDSVMFDNVVYAFPPNMKKD